jgi:carbonic anhydrase
VPTHLDEVTMEQLLEGHRKFLGEVFPGRRSHFHLLAESQAPEYLFITCSDSRIVPDMILGTEPGDLFITRNAGNVVPVSGNDVDGCTATIEYAVEVLRVKDAIVCGHSDCGAMKAELDHRLLENLPKARRWLEHVEAAYDYRQPLNSADGEGAELA